MSTHRRWYQGSREKRHGSSLLGLPGFCGPQLFSHLSCRLGNWGRCVLQFFIDIFQLAQGARISEPSTPSAWRAVQLQKRVVSLSTGPWHTKTKEPKAKLYSCLTGTNCLISCVFKQVHFIQIVKLTASCLFIPLLSVHLWEPLQRSL